MNDRHETVKCEARLTTWQPQEQEPEAYLNSTSQGAESEETRQDAHLPGRSRRIMKYPGEFAGCGIRRSGLYQNVGVDLSGGGPRIFCRHFETTGVDPYLGVVLKTGKS